MALRRQALLSASALVMSACFAQASWAAAESGPTSQGDSAAAQLFVLGTTTATQLDPDQIEGEDPAEEPTSEIGIDSIVV